MTSIPASRNARAMIFAPLSCPSRPGLATTTRIFLFVAVDMSGCAAHGRRGPGTLIVRVRERRADATQGTVPPVADATQGTVPPVAFPTGGRYAASWRKATMA